MYDLSKNELDLMEVFWAAEKPMTRAEIIEASTSRSWSINSLYLLLNSLLRKEIIETAGAVRCGKGFGHTYKSVLNRGDFVASQVTGYLEKEADDSTVRTVAKALIESDRVSAETLKDLEALIRKRQKMLNP